jgi:hypothetical protein
MDWRELPASPEDITHVNSHGSLFVAGSNTLRRPVALKAACPTLPIWAAQQVGSYLGYTGSDADIVAEAALDPKRPLAI